MNPRTPSGQGLKAQRGDLIKYRDLREDFAKWLRNRTSNEYANQLIRYLDRFVKHTIKDAEDVLSIVESSTSRKNIILALRNLINFCDHRGIISRDFAETLKRELKCVKSQTDGYIPSDEEVKRVYCTIDKEHYRIFYKLIVFSGLRSREAVGLLNKFDRKKVMINGRIAKYPLFLDRSEKKTYFAYFPAKFAKELKRSSITEHGVKNYFYRRNLSPKYLRKWHYNFLILNGVPESVADFIQGRASFTVGSMHYLAKVKQADEWYSRVIDKFRRVLPQ